MPRPQRRTQVERREEAERRMLEAAVRLIAERGLEGLALADVGVEAGYSRGLPAHHYGNRANFEVVLAHFVRDEFLHEMAEINRSPGLAGLLQLVRSFCDPKKDSLCSCVVHIVLSDYTLGGKANDGLQVIADLRDVSRALLEQSIAEGIKLGEIRPDADAKRLSFMLVAFINALIKEWLVDRTINLVAAGEEFIHLLVNGLASPYRAPQKAANAE